MDEPEVVTVADSPAARHGYRRATFDLPETLAAAVDHMAPLTTGTVAGYVRRALLAQLDVDRKAGRAV